MMKCEHGHEIVTCGLGCANNPRINPIAWDEKRDMFASAALTGVMANHGYFFDDAYTPTMTSDQVAIRHATNTMLELYGPRPTEVKE